MRYLILAAVLVLSFWGCGEDESTNGPADAGGAAGGAGGAGGQSAGGGGAGGLACNEYCGPVVGCSTGVTTQECLTSCLAAPELNTTQCHDAYRARNQCVGALDCAGYEQYVNGSGGGRPCADEEAAIVDACAS